MNTCNLVRITFVSLKDLSGLKQSDTSTGNNAFLHGGFGSGQSIFYPVLFLFEFNLRCRADLDYSHTSVSFANRSASFSLSKSEVLLSRAALISFTRASISSFSPLPSTIVVLSLSEITFRASPRSANPAFSSFKTDFLGNNFTSGLSGDIFKNFFPAISEGRSFNRQNAERPAEFIDYESRERFTFDIFRYNNQFFLSALGNLLKQKAGFPEPSLSFCRLSKS